MGTTGAEVRAGGTRLACGAARCRLKATPRRGAGVGGSGANVTCAGDAGPGDALTGAIGAEDPVSCASASAGFRDSRCADSSGKFTGMSLGNSEIRERRSPKSPKPRRESSRSAFSLFRFSRDIDMPIIGMVELDCSRKLRVGLGERDVGIAVSVRRAGTSSCDLGCDTGDAGA